MNVLRIFVLCPVHLIQYFLLHFITNSASNGGLSELEHQRQFQHETTTTGHPQVAATTEGGELLEKLFSTPRPKVVNPKVGPVILPTTDNSSSDESEQSEESEEESPLPPQPNRARNCDHLAHFCHIAIYRKIMQRECQTTCGRRDECQDVREDLCIQWARRNFCTLRFYSTMRWRCARTCRLCIPIQ
uniref:ShKT domain-containing protein n=1 Tax=Globodera rostochiensis TaxID=31243 RepID=A0A914HV39_GLORO